MVLLTFTVNLVRSGNKVICLGYEALQDLLEWENSITSSMKRINSINPQH